MRKHLPFLLLTFFIFLSCQISEEERIDQTLNRREEAFQKKDLSLYLSCVSSAYRDKEEDYGQLRKRIEGYFKTFDQIKYNSWDRSIYIEGDTAKVIQQFHLEVEKGGRTNRYSGKELLFFEKEGRKWKIIKGL
jgi:ketosteroid isomerase-like protein